MRLGVYIVVLSLIWLAVAVGDPAAIAPDKGITLFLKIITYDNSYQFDRTKTVNVYLPYERSNAVSYQQFRGAREFLENASNLKVAGARVRFRPFQIDSLKTVLKTVSEADYNIMVITSLGEPQVRNILSFTQALGIRTFALDPNLVSVGVAVGIRPYLKKKSILVNVAAAREEGSQFGAPLLKMCEIYDGKS